MQNAFFMQIVYSNASLEEIDKGFFLDDFLALPEIEEQITVLRVLQNQINIIVIFKRIV